ncbi:unnamed protein product [Hapterophycus canaliculatus]
MIRSATSASATRAVCRLSTCVAGHHQHRAATTAAVGALMCRVRTSEVSTLGRVEVPPPPRRSFASAVATTFEEGAGGMGAAAEEETVEREKQELQQRPQQHPQKQTESKPKPRRRRLLRDRPAPITLTDRAAAHLVSLVESKPGKIGVRLGVKRRGCNGMSYTLKYADEKPKGDEEVVVQAVPSAAGGAAEEASGEEGGAAATAAGGGGGGEVRLFVDPMATLYIAGTVMDWEETELSSEFTFTNPNAKGECGCGESFNV